MLPLASRFSAIPVIVLVAVCHATIFFHSDFERGETYLAKALKPGAKTIELVLNSRLKEWPAEGGEGVIEGNYASAAENLRYKRREKNRLLGVTGIGKPHAKRVSIQTGNLDEWYRQFGEDTTDSRYAARTEAKYALFGLHSARFDGRSIKENSLGRNFSETIDSCFHSRFYIRVSNLDVFGQGMRELGIAHWSIAEGTIPRISLVSVEGEDGPQFGFARKVEGTWKILRRQRPLPGSERLDTARAYCLEISICMEDSNLARLVMHVDGAIRENLLIRLTPSEDRYHSFVIGKLRRVPVGAAFVFDEVVLSASPIGMIPASPRLYLAQDTVWLKTATVGRTLLKSLQWQISPQNSWMLPEFNSGECKASLTHLTVPPTTRVTELVGKGLEEIDPIDVPALLKKGRQYLARARLRSVSGSWGEWCEPIIFGVPRESASSFAGTPGLPKLDAVHFANEGKRSVLKSIRKGKWYDIHFTFSGSRKGEFEMDTFVDLYFHGRPEEALANYNNRGGDFSVADNYVVSLNMGLRQVYAKLPDRPESFSYVDPEMEPHYCDGRESTFLFDTEAGRGRFRFRLLDSAVTGTWQVCGFVRNRYGLVSPMFRGAFVVASHSSAPAGSPIPWGGIGGGIVLVAGIGALLALRSRKRNSVAEKSNTGDHQVQIGSAHKERVAAALQFIKENYLKQISPKDVAVAIGVTPGWLSTIFRESTEKTVIQYINELRIDEAKRLLTETETSITKISDMTGFKTVYGFGDAFRKAVGQSPAEFRKRGQR